MRNQAPSSGGDAPRGEGDGSHFATAAVDSQLRQTLASLPDPLTFLESLFAHAPVALQIYAADGHSLLVNDAFRTMFGAEPPADYNLFKDEIARKNGLFDLIRRAFQGETIRLPPFWYDPRELEHVHIGQANRVAIESTFVPLGDQTGRVTHVAIFFKDMTEQLAASERIAAERDRINEEKAMLDAVLKTAPVGLSFLDRDLCYVRINDAIAEINGVPADETIGKRIDEVVPHLAATLEPIYREVMESGVARLHMEVRGETRAAPGSERIWDVSYYPVHDAEGAVRWAGTVVLDVTERRRAEAAMRASLERETAARETAERSEAEYRFLCESLPDIIWTGNPDGTLDYVNRVFSEYVGRKGLEGIDWTEILHPDDLPVAIAAWRAAVGTGARYEVEHRVRRFDGSYRWFVARATAMRDASGRIVKWFGAATDVHDARESARERERLLEETRRARALTELAQARTAFLAEITEILAGSTELEQSLALLARRTIPMLADVAGVYLKQEDGEIRQIAVAHADPSLEPDIWELHALLPLRVEQTTLLPEVIRTGKPKLMTRVRSVLVDEAQPQGRIGAILARLRLRSYMAVPIRRGDETVGAIALSSTDDSLRTFTDADVQLGMEVARRAGVALENARLVRELRESVRIRDDFLSIASHELNTPLTSISLNLAALVRRLPEDRAVLLERLKKIQKGAERLHGLVRELLDVSRIEARKLVLEREPLDVTALVSEVVARFAEEASRAGSTIRLSAAEAVVGSWDRLRLEQVVTNLISNAVKFGRGQPVDVEIVRAGDRVRIAVRDHGIGIEPDQALRIFERFERAVSTRHFGGFGLGLWISRQIVEGHGGRIEVKSEIGRGATFAVDLPIGEAQRSGGGEREAPPHAHAG